MSDTERGATDGGHGRLPTPTVIAAAGVTGLLGLAGVTWRALEAQAMDTARRVEAAAVDAAVAAGAIPADGTVAAGDIPAPNGDGRYPPPQATASDGADTALPRDLRLVMLGDSTAVGYGTSEVSEVPGVLLAGVVAAALRVPVALRTFAKVGAVSAELDDQVAAATAVGPDLAVIVVGANDVVGKIPPHRAASQLGAAVAALRAEHVDVVVATCPDFGVIAPIPQPLRALVSRWSRRLADLQDRAVRSAGGVPVPIGRLVSPGFRGRPELFFGDGFHPSAAGYRKAVEAMTPAVLAAARRAVGGPAQVSELGA